MAMLGIDEIHPLVRLNDHTKTAGMEFSAQEFASATRMPVSYTHLLRHRRAGDPRGADGGGACAGHRLRPAGRGERTRQCAGQPL